MSHASDLNELNRVNHLQHATRVPWLVRLSWVLLWWGTALVSLLGWGGPSHALL
ncbi:MAG: hypothetical protein RLZZ612_2124, partial [Pseudomonadota bacterium]